MFIVRFFLTSIFHLFSIIPTLLLLIWIFLEIRRLYLKLAIVRFTIPHRILKSLKQSAKNQSMSLDKYISLIFDAHIQSSISAFTDNIVFDNSSTKSYSGNIRIKGIILSDTASRFAHKDASLFGISLEQHLSDIIQTYYRQSKIR